LAQSVAIDRSTNRISLFNILESLITDPKGLILQEMVAVSIWIFDKSEFGTDHQLQLSIIAPDGSAHGPFNQNFTVTAIRHRLINTFESHEFDQEGDWTFRASLDGIASASATHTVAIRFGQPDKAIDQ